jgi:hypothetical protein
LTAASLIVIDPTHPRVVIWKIRVTKRLPVRRPASRDTAALYQSVCTGLHQDRHKGPSPQAIAAALPALISPVVDDLRREMSQPSLPLRV